MRNLTVLVCAGVFVVSAPNSSAAQNSSDQASKLAAAREYIRASSAVDAMVSAMRANLPAQRQAMPQVPEEFWNRFEEVMVKEAPTFGDSVAVLYARTFSVRELQELTAFLKSPIGRRFVESQPFLISESAAIGQRWGARLGEQIAKELIQ